MNGVLIGEQNVRDDKCGRYTHVITEQEILIVHSLLYTIKCMHLTKATVSSLYLTAPIVKEANAYMQLYVITCGLTCGHTHHHIQVTHHYMQLYTGKDVHVTS